MIEPRARSDGSVAYRVRRRSRGKWIDFGTYDSPEAAADADAQARVLARSGKLDSLLRGNVRVDQYVVQVWWPAYAEAELGTRTRGRYREIWNGHLRDRVSGYLIREITPAVADEIKQRLLRATSVRNTQMALMMMQAVMRHAIVAGEHPGPNPFKEIKKPRSAPGEEVVPLTPLQVERVRAYFIANRDIESATLISLLAYELLRPEEAQALMPAKERGDRLVIDRAVEPEADYDAAERAAHRGQLGRTRLAPTKTRRNRSVTLAAAVRSDLAELRLARGGVGPRDLYFARKKDGDPWWTTDYANWRRRKFKAALAAAGLPTTTRPYDLRHTGISLRLREGWAPSRVAREAGHSTATMHRVYEHEIEALRGQPQSSMDEMIRAARAETALDQRAVAE